MQRAADEVRGELEAGERETLEHMTRARLLRQRQVGEAVDAVEGEPAPRWDPEEHEDQLIKGLLQACLAQPPPLGCHSPLQRQTSAEDYRFVGGVSSQACDAMGEAEALLALLEQEA
jgi:hypothetical protein